MGAAFLLGGCGSSGQDQVWAKVRQLESAVSSLGAPAISR